MFVLFQEGTEVEEDEEKEEGGVYSPRDHLGIVGCNEHRRNTKIC